MDTSDQLEYLTQLAQQLGLEVRFLDGSGRPDQPGGAVVKLKGREILFIDSSASLLDQVEAAADFLNGRPELADMYLPPVIRDRLSAE